MNPMVPLANLLMFGYLTVLALFAIANCWLVFAARPRGLKDPNAGHVHQGVARSRHNTNGQEIVVVECATCKLHMNYVESVSV